MFCFKTPSGGKSTEHRTQNTDCINAHMAHIFKKAHISKKAHFPLEEVKRCRQFLDATNCREVVWILTAPTDEGPKVAVALEIHSAAFHILSPPFFSFSSSMMTQCLSRSQIYFADFSCSFFARALILSKSPYFASCACSSFVILPSRNAWAA